MNIFIRLITKYQKLSWIRYVYCFKVISPLCSLRNIKKLRFYHSTKYFTINNYKHARYGTKTGLIQNFSGTDVFGKFNEPFELCLQIFCLQVENVVCQVHDVIGTRPHAKDKHQFEHRKASLHQLEINLEMKLSRCLRF